jgi:hypothetical protein
MGGAPRLAGAAIVFADKLPLHEGLNPANPGLRFKQHRGGSGVAGLRPIATETQAAAHSFIAIVAQGAECGFIVKLGKLRQTFPNRTLLRHLPRTRQLIVELGFMINPNPAQPPTLKPGGGFAKNRVRQ